MICSSCLKDSPIVYSDWAKGFSCYLCSTCADSLSYAYEKNLLSSCYSCLKLFKPKKQAQNKCGSCWKAFFNSKRNLTVITTTEEQPEVQECLWVR